MRYFIHLAYVGTHYKGWQRQLNTKNSVQQVLEENMTKMLNTPIHLMGCGRTDAGVHAKQFYCHFDYDQILEAKHIDIINKILPDDIVVYNFLPVHPRAHSRFDAVKRSYEYHIHLSPDPFLNQFSSYYNFKTLDLNLVNLGLEWISQLKDFRSFCLTPEKFENTNCTIYTADLATFENGKKMIFYFTANRFLKSMIRMIVAKLLALGQGKISFDDFKNYNIDNQTKNFQTLANPQGLHLTKIEYPSAIVLSEIKS